MFDYEIVVGAASVEVWRNGLNSSRHLVAEVAEDATLAEIAQEFYEALANTNNHICVIREG